MAEKKELSFAVLFEELEGIVSDLEGNEVALEDALSLFERGVTLCRQGNKRLSMAERRIEQLLNDSETGKELRVPWEEAEKG